MINDQKVYVIMPARGGSQRLPRKNIYPIWGKPMLYWGVRACKMSNYIDKVFVSTEDDEIVKVALDCGAKIIERIPSLSDDKTFKQEVIVAALNTLYFKADVPDIVISLQPNSPEVRPVDLDCALEKFIEYDRHELFTVNPQLIQNAAFRIMRYTYAFQKSLSTRCGVYVTDYVDVHDIDDVRFLEENREPAEGEHVS